MTATTDKPLTIADATAEVAAAKAHRAALGDRMSRSPDTVRPAELRDSDDAVLFASARLVAAQRAEEGRAQREALAELPRHEANLAKCDEQEGLRRWQRLVASLDSYNQWVSTQNGIHAHELAWARAVGPLVGDGPDAPIQTGGSAWPGLRIGDALGCARAHAGISGSFVPTSPPPRPAPPEAPAPRCPQGGAGGAHMIFAERDEYGRETGRTVCGLCHKVFTGTWTPVRQG